MNPKDFDPRALLIFCLAIVPLRGSCGDSSSKSPVATTSKSGLTKSLVVDGERFTTRKVIDQQQGGIPVGVILAPEKWKDVTQVVWNYEHNSNPVEISGKIESPANEEALFYYPQILYFWLRPPSQFHQVGQSYGGLVHAQPQPPAPTLLAFVQKTRGNQPRFKIIGSKDLPDLPGVLKTQSQSKNQRGVGLKVSYPLYGTSQHSINEQYHWTDGYGDYRHSNDATYGPNQHENGDWQIMQPAK